MFGYVKTDIPNMYVKDTVLYKAMYCGLCKGIGKTCGNKARLVLNYDLTFLSVLLHNLADIDVNIQRQRCIIHHVRKRPVAVPDALTERIAALNVILAYYKLNDDVLDNGKGRLKRSFFNTSYKKAKKLEPNLDKIVSKRYAQLLKLEKACCDSVDIIADPFGNMMQDIVVELIDENICSEQVKQIAYNLGKWVYLIDALDDFDKDIKKNNYNVFVNMYKDIPNKCTLLKEKQSDLIFTFGMLLADIERLSKELKYKFNHDLTDNVFIHGLKVETKRIMENKKCKNTIKY